MEKTKSVLLTILFCLAVMVATTEADSRYEFERCIRQDYEEDGVVEGVEWDLDAEEVTSVQFFFLSPHAPWNGSEDLLKIEINYESWNESGRRTDLLFVPPVPHGQFSLPRPTLNASLIPLPDLRVGWNNITLTLVGDPFESRRLYVDNVTTGVNINPRGSVNLTVKGLDPRVNCNRTINYNDNVLKGYRGYEFPRSAPPPVGRVFGFFWNETKNVTVALREEGGRQFIGLPRFFDRRTVTTFPRGKNLTWCRPQNFSEDENEFFHLMRECRPGWEEAPKGYDAWTYIFASVEDLKEEEDVFVAKNCGFVQLNFTLTGEDTGSYWFETHVQWPTNVFYDDVFPLEGQCLPYPVALLCVAIAMGIFQFGLIASIVSYSLKLWRQKKKNKKLAEERESLKKEYVKKFAVWYINAYPGEIKKLLDERKERKRQIARVCPSLLAAEEDAYDPPSVSIVTTDSTRRLQRLQSDPYETLPEAPSTLVSGPGEGSGPSVLLDLQSKTASFTTDANDATGSCPAKL